MTLAPHGDSDIADLVNLARSVAARADDACARRLDGLTAQERTLVYRIAMALGAPEIEPGSPA